MKNYKIILILKYYFLAKTYKVKYFIIYINVFNNYSLVILY